MDQQFPNGGKDDNLHLLIEKCIRNFKDEKSVRNDTRFLEIWLKYAAMSGHPVEVYDFMFKQGLCSQQVGLYEIWAWQLEKIGSYKQAESVFVKGIGSLVDLYQREWINSKRTEFQARVIVRMNGVETEEEQKSALNKLTGHGKIHKVVGGRLGYSNVEDPGPGEQLHAGGSGEGAHAKQPLGTNNGQARCVIGRWKFKFEEKEEPVIN